MAINGKSKLCFWTGRNQPPTTRLGPNSSLVPKPYVFFALDKLKA